MNAQRQNLYPVHASSLVAAFAEEPVEIDGMKVEFDEKVSLLPVSVEVVDARDSAGGGRRDGKTNGRNDPYGANGA